MTEGLGAGSSLCLLGHDLPVMQQNMGTDTTTRRFVSTYSLVTESLTSQFCNEVIRK